MEVEKKGRSTPTPTHDRKPKLTLNFKLGRREGVFIVPHVGNPMPGKRIQESEFAETKLRYRDKSEQIYEKPRRK